MRIERARGTRDFLPKEMRKRRIMEERMRNIAERWGYEEIRTPTFERAELFTQKSGEAILKEMYEFRDKGDRHLALRPELTAPVIRMYINELKMTPKPTKVYYFGNCFRYEEPQKARYREFWQFGAEIIGSDRPEAQAELIALAFNILKSLGVKAELHVGHVGLIRERLRVLHADEEQINTVMRLMDKEEEDRHAVIELMDERERDGIGDLLDGLSDLIDSKGKNALQEARDRNIIAADSDTLRELELLLEYLDYYGVDYTLNLGIARGLDYYTGMVFEIYDTGGMLGAQNQICGGGSYRLAALFGGDDIPLTGFAFGFDRLEEIFSVDDKDLERRGVVVVPIRDKDADRAVMKEAIKIASRLREFVPTHIDLMNRSLSAQLKYANAHHDSFAVLVGKNELKEAKVTLRNLNTGEQEKMSVEDCVAKIKGLFWGERGREMTDDEDLSDFENKMRALEEAIKRDEEAFYGDRTIKEAYNPKNVGALDNPDGAASITDHKGDTMQIHLRVEGNTIKDSKFTTDAYGPTVACGSVITGLVKGKTIEEAFGIEIKDIESVLGRLPEENVSSPVLAVNTLKAALEDYKKKY